MGQLSKVYKLRGQMMKERLAKQELRCDLPVDSVTDNIEFDRWMSEVSRHIERMSGLTSDDLPDYDYRGAFDSGRRTLYVASDSLVEAGF